MENRKKDHIDLAFKAQVLAQDKDNRFYYEPMLSPHPAAEPVPFEFLGRTLKVPFWVSSMTGGTELAGHINTNLARACREFGMGMGLGSCRILLEGETSFGDFNMRPVIGPDLPLYANIGIAQLEQVYRIKSWQKLQQLVDRLQADGLIVHVNPFQEWMQPEGDRLGVSALSLVKELLDHTRLRIIVKEVGQGMGPASLKELLSLPLAAIEFGAFGGTNFARLEMLRNSPLEAEVNEAIARVGHTADEMVRFVNDILQKDEKPACNQLIISGGLKSYLDGYYLVKKSRLKAVFGQASGMLRHARGEYAELRRYVELQVKGYRLAETFLRIRED